MKKMLYWTGVLTLTILFASCSSGRKASTSTTVTPGEIEVTIPLGGPEYQSNAEYWRAVQTGTSKDMSMAKKVAMQNARQALADYIRIVQTEAKKRAGDGNTDPLLAATEKYRQGGKRHGET